MREYKFLIPVLRDSDRQPHDRRPLDWLDSLLVAEFGGFTRGDPVQGGWQGSESLILDESIPYWIAAVSEKAVLETIWRCCDRFDQQCIYLRKPDGSVLLVNRLATANLQALEQ